MHHITSYNYNTLLSHLDGKDWSFFSNMLFDKIDKCLMHFKSF